MATPTSALQWTARRAGAALCAFLVCGCTATRPTPEASAAAPLPRSFAAPHDADAAARSEAWWRAFEVPQLEPLVREALLGNRSLRATAERVEAAAALVREAGSARLPQVDATFDATRARQNIIGVVPGQPLLTSRATNFGLGATVSWELDLWGRLAAAESAADQRLAASEWELEAAAQSLAGATVKAWVAAVAAQADLGLAERTLANRTTALRTSEQRFESGLAPAVDVELARAEEAFARAELAAARERVGAGRRALELLLGRYPTGTLELGPELPALGAAVRAGLPADLLDRRPDLRAARARLDAAADEAAVARADRYPRIALTAAGGTRSDELGDLLDGDFRVWSIAGNVLAPVFDGGRLRARAAARDAEFAAAVEDFAGRVLAACGEVEDLLAAEAFLLDRERALVEAERAAAAAERSALERYRGGQGDLSTLLLAQRSALAAQSQRIAVRAQRLATRVDLHLALGGTLADAPLAPLDARREDETP